MKKFFPIFFVGFFALDAFAKDDLKQGVMRGLVEKNTDHFDLSDEEVGFKPNIKNRLVFDLDFDNNYQSTSRKEEFKEAYALGRFFSTINFSRNVFLNYFVRLQEEDQASEVSRRNSRADGGGDRFFDNHGANLEEFVLAYDSKRFALVAGKFNPNYGTAWRQGRGIWNYKIAENYHQQEKLGFATIFRAGNSKKTGEYDFGLSVFTNDRKNFDNSAMTKRDSDRKSDAKPGDTRSLASYVASLDVDFDFALQEKLTYHFAYANLAVNDRASQISPTKIDSQKGFVASLNYKYPLAENFALDGLLEFNQTKNLGGNSDIGERYFIGSLVAKIFKNWNATFGHSSRQNIESNAYGFDQNLSEISFGYDFNKTVLFDHLTLQFGYKNQRTNFKTSLDTQNSAGLLLRYYKTF